MAHRDQAQAKYERYRLAVDALLTRLPELKQRASVHFLVNMLEAYYFADIQALNQLYSFTPPLPEPGGAVEEIHHPKNELKHLWRQYGRSGFDEKEDGATIVPALRVERVLSRADGCTWLRTLFAWCVEQIIERYYEMQLNPEGLEMICQEGNWNNFIEQCHLRDGRFAEVTRPQLRFFGTTA